MERFHDKCVEDILGRLGDLSGNKIRSGLARGMVMSFTSVKADATSENSVFASFRLYDSVFTMCETIKDTRLFCKTGLGGFLDTWALYCLFLERDTWTPRGLSHEELVLSLKRDIQTKKGKAPRNGMVATITVIGEAGRVSRQEAVFCRCTDGMPYSRVHNQEGMHYRMSFGGEYDDLVALNRKLTKEGWCLPKYIGDEYAESEEEKE